MQFTTTALAALALPALALAQTAHVINNCTFPAYLQSVGNNNGPKGPVLTIAPKGTYSEPYKAGGAEIHLGTLSALRTPLSFDYTPSNGLVYYDLSDTFGNPFSQYNNVLTPGNTKCYAFNCAKGQETCYSSGNHLHIENCADTPLTLTLCHA